jgi:hypothetical protein
MKIKKREKFYDIVIKKNDFKKKKLPLYSSTTELALQIVSIKD